MRSADDQSSLFDFGNRNAGDLQELKPVPILRVQLVHDPRPTLYSTSELTNANQAFDILRRYIEHEDREHLAVLMLDVKCRILGLHTVSIGSINSAIVCSREVFKAAILANSTGIIVAHNHPSGDPSPSPEDIQVTRLLKDAGEVLDIHLMDHLIIGHEGAYHSMKHHSGIL